MSKSDQQHPDNPVPTDDDLSYGTTVFDTAPHGFGMGMIIGKITHWAVDWTPENGYLYLVEHTNPDGTIGTSRYMNWRLEVG